MLLALLAQLNRAFPTLSLLDVGSMLKQISQVLEIMVILVTVCGGWLGVRLLKGKALFRRFEAA